MVFSIEDQMVVSMPRSSLLEDQNMEVFSYRSKREDLEFSLIDDMNVFPYRSFRSSKREDLYFSLRRSGGLLF